MILVLAALLQAAPPPPPVMPPQSPPFVTCPDGALARGGACPAPSPEGLRQLCRNGAQVTATEACPPSQTWRIFFDSGEAKLSRDAEAVLDEVAALARSRLRGALIIVESHTDRSGPAGANMKFAERRAVLVREALAARIGWRDTIRTVALGEGRPLVETPDGVREPQNRRVEIHFEPR